MLLNKSGRSIPTVLVSSVASGEPQHLVSLDLARVFRSFERRTLLIDCDTSRPYLSRQLSADHLSGVIQVCRGQADPHTCIVPSFEEGLDFMPLGQSNELTPWIDPQAFQVVLASLRTDYDAIVINGPALLSSAATLLLASGVDQTLFAVFNGISRWDQLAASEQAVLQAGIDIFGSVLRSPSDAAKLDLRFDRQGIRRAVEREETSEESLQETVTAIRQDLRQVGSPAPESQTRPASYKNVTS
jgi:Mrp family chromosome partitioning ATPase